MRLAGYAVAGTFKNTGFFLKGDAAMVQLFGQIIMVGLVIGVVGTICIVLLDRY
jgi:hypothetical protein